MSSASGVQRRTRWAGLAVVALLAIATALAGCQGEPERVELPRQQIIPGRSKAHWRGTLRRNDQAWASLEATCDVTISNPQIQSASKSVRFTGGRLVVQKPDKVYLRVPASGKLRMLLVGNGQVYRADMPVFGDAYAGTYEDPVIPQAGRIHMMPADIAHAFCPDALLTDRALVLTEWERISKLSVLMLVEEPAPDLKMTAGITLDRATEAVMSIEKYDFDGSIRAGVSYPRKTAVTVSEDRSVSVPAQVLIDYPTERTRILLSLDDVTLNEPPDQSLFVVGP